jgi:phosphoribosylformylglycinamidine (FGAM) synthase-like amidotransferase family enzyme
MSTAAKHTPGPFFLTKETIEGEFCTYAKIRDSTDAVIAVLHVNEIGNGLLLTAAPEMLEVLESIEIALSMGFSKGDVLQEGFAIRNAIKAAIAKAKGQTP